MQMFAQIIKRLSEIGFELRRARVCVLSIECAGDYRRVCEVCNELCVSNLARSVIQSGDLNLRIRLVIQSCLIQTLIRTDCDLCAPK